MDIYGAEDWKNVLCFFKCLDDYVGTIFDKACSLH